MPDGDVTISVTLDTKDIKAKIDELTKDLQKMASAAQDNGMTKEFQAITALLDKVSVRVDAVVTKMERLERTGAGNPEEFEQMQDALLGYAYQLGVAEARVRANGTVAEQTGKKSSTAFNNAATNVSKYSKKTTSALNKIKKSASQAFSFKGLSVGIRRLAQLAFGVYSVTALLNKLKSAIKEGINNLVQFQSDTNATNEAMTELKTSLLFIQNAWGAAFAPVINVVQPILTSLMNTFAEVGNTIARFFGALTGQQQVIQALRVSTGDYAASLNKAGGAAKKLQDRLANFDDLNVLGKDSDSGGGGGASGPDPSEMFEYVDVDSSEFAGILGFFDDLKKKIGESGLIDAFNNLWEAMQKFKDSPLVKTLEAIALWLAESTFTSVLSVLTNTLNLLADILNGDLDTGLQDLNKLLADLTFDPLIAIAGAFDIIFGTDVAGWLEDVKKSIEEIDFTQLPGYNKLVEALGQLETSWNNLKDSLKNFWDMLEETGVLDVLKGAITEFVKLGWDLVLQGVASALSLLADSLQIIADIFAGDFPAVLDDIKNTLADIDFQPLETVASVLDRILGTDIAGWLGGVHEKIEELHFQDFVDSLVEGWERIKSAFWLGVGVIAALLGITDEKFQAFSSAIHTIMSVLKTFLTNTWLFIKMNVTSAVTELSETMQRVWNSIKDFVQVPANAIIGYINRLIGALEGMVNGMADTIGQIKLDIPDWVPEWGGKSINFNLGHVSIPRVPYLAEGAVIPPNREFMAVLGDQSHGTNIEAPLDTIKQAVEDVVGSGNAEVVALLQQLIAVVDSKNLTIGDKEIGRANARYAQQQNRIRGVGF